MARNPNPTDPPAIRRELARVWQEHQQVCAKIGDLLQLAAYIEQRGNDLLDMLTNANEGHATRPC